MFSGSKNRDKQKQFTRLGDKGGPTPPLLIRVMIGGVETAVKLPKLPPAWEQKTYPSRKYYGTFAYSVRDDVNTRI